jgi:tRNA-2-methylthio-N6-dimethylallyladenosine synthase
MSTVKVYIETYGCQMNVSDSERMTSRLLSSGYEITDATDKADVILLNTCSVRAKAENKVFSRIESLRSGRRKQLPLIGLTGCVAQLEGSAIFAGAPDVSFVAGTRSTDRIPALLKRALEGESQIIDLGDREENGSWDVGPGERFSKHVAYVPIIEGCNKFCTYCIVPYSRGREVSRPASEIVEEVRKLCDDGFKEVHLIGQNVNSYRPRTDNGLEAFRGSTPFSRLLRAVAQTGMARIKFTTSFPRDFHPDIVNAIEENENLCNWVHLPVQSGSDRILKRMRRGYTASDYMRRVVAIKKSKRRLALTSDIIVGFPGETDLEGNAGREIRRPRRRATDLRALRLSGETTEKSPEGSLR